jgi:hypothetical protein
MRLRIKPEGPRMASAEGRECSLQKKCSDMVVGAVCESAVASVAQKADMGVVLLSDISVQWPFIRRRREDGDDIQELNADVVISQRAWPRASSPRELLSRKMRFMSREGWR